MYLACYINRMTSGASGASGEEGRVIARPDRGQSFKVSTATRTNVGVAKPHKSRLFSAPALLLLGLICGVALYGLIQLKIGQRLLGVAGGKPLEPVGVVMKNQPPDPFTEAVNNVEADRGEAAGRAAEVIIPEELKKYRDPRLFLAVQAAASRAAGIRSPHDLAELASSLARRDQTLVEVPRLGAGYLLYGVGFMATGMLTHFDAATGKSVPLFADDVELKSEEERLSAERTRLAAELEELQRRLKTTGKREREARALLLADAASKKKEFASLEDHAKRLAASYGEARSRRLLFAEYDALAALARDFDGRVYDLKVHSSAKEFEARLLSHARPEALGVLEQLGATYREKFGRLLPITSLIRTREYQRRLREAGNPNAVNADPPPHTTGLAFDIYYRYMSASEQEFVMEEIARLEREGRVEALRERRDHYHVFVFPGGQRPGEKEIAQVTRTPNPPSRKK